MLDSHNTTAGYGMLNHARKAAVIGAYQSAEHYCDPLPEPFPVAPATLAGADLPWGMILYIGQHFQRAGTRPPVGNERDGHGAYRPVLARA